VAGGDRGPPWQGAPEEQVTRTFAEGRARPVDEQWDGIPGGETFRASTSG
jgi:hypothetical protein